jgi:hypothetical protein
MKSGICGVFELAILDHFELIEHIAFGRIRNADLPCTIGHGRCNPAELLCQRHQPLCETERRPKYSDLRFFAIKALKLR